MREGHYLVLVAVGVLTGLGAAVVFAVLREWGAAIGGAAWASWALAAGVEHMSRRA